MTNEQNYQDCIEALLRCATECQQCASFCLREEEDNLMAKCIKLDMECAAICYATAQLMNLGSEFAGDLCRICAEICDACAKECAKHEADHCQRCAVECTACAEECRKMEFASQE